MSQAELRRHNETVLEELEPGDLIEFNRGRYSHWAVYYGNGKVIHLTGDANDGLNADVNSGSLFTICGKKFDKAFVKIDEFWDVVLDSKVCKNNEKDKSRKPKSPQEILKTAKSKEGEIGYNVIWKNCEHFANFCRYGIATSDQVTDKLIALCVVVIVALLVLVHNTNKRKTHKK